MLIVLFYLVQLLGRNRSDVADSAGFDNPLKFVTSITQYFLKNFRCVLAE